MGMENFGPPAGFNIMFTIFPILFIIVFVIIIVSILGSGVRYYQNARSPRETVFAKVVAKRTEVRGRSHHHHHDHGVTHHSSRTYYYITLEFDKGERREYLDVKNLYGIVVEGDEGYAAVQGDWIVAFERRAE